MLERALKVKKVIPGSTIFASCDSEEVESPLEFVLFREISVVAVVLRLWHLSLTINATYNEKFQQ